MNSLLRRSASIASSPSRRAFVAAASFLSPATSPESTWPHIGRDQLDSAAALSPDLSRMLIGRGPLVVVVGVLRRGFHSSWGPLGFRATSAAARAEVAIDDGAGEGLDISKLGISRQIVSQLGARGITTLFPIQRAVLEPAMQGRDMIGRARTGTGKTLAFGIPIMDKIICFNEKNGRGRNPLAIVLAPTRELARQVEKEFRESAPLDTLCVYGGVPINQQMRVLNYGVDVVVGTPGRIIDLLRRGSLDLSEIQFAVLDEADQMLAVGFDEDVEKIMEKLPQNRQSMMFSATMPSWIRKISQKYLKDPITVDLVGDSDQKLPEGISLYSIASDNYGKASILGPLIKEHAKGGKCIVFTQTKRGADQLAYAMGRSYACQALHGDISQNQRERTLAGFRDGRFNILVATDVAARGLDIPNVDLVVHYELPNTSDLFVHRSGRTARAGKKGSAILIYTYEQTRAVRVIEQDIGCRFTELPKIAAEDGSPGMFDIMDGTRFNSYGGGRMGGSSFGREGYGGSSARRARGFGGSPRRSGGYGDSGLNRYGGFDGFGDSNSDRSSGFGGSSFGRSDRYGDPGRGRFGRRGDSKYRRSNSFDDSGSGHFGSFGDSHSA